jgi:3-deoxy-D-manno-octulosonate 8-phosphate phosphatase KdsC-like HAD superfamily phosphatase
MASNGETDALNTSEWEHAQSQLASARDEVASVPGFARQSAYTRLLAAERRCTALVHGWLAQAFHLERVVEPHLVLSLDVDGVLEEQGDGFSATGVTGAAALRLLQLGRVAVLLNTGRSLMEVQDRVEQLALIGGVGSFGAAVWDGIYGRAYSLVSERGREQLAGLRGVVRVDPGLVQDLSHAESIRVSQVVDGGLKPIAGTDARALLDRNGFTDLAFWVAPSHIDFVDRRIDKGIGLTRLREALGLEHLALAAMGDSACDIPTFRQAMRAFVPAATLPSYIPGRRQNLIRSRHLGEQALWDAAFRLVPDASPRRRVRSVIEGLVFPEWFPPSLRRGPVPDRLSLSRWRPTRFLARYKTTT